MHEPWGHYAKWHKSEKNKYQMISLSRGIFLKKNPEWISVHFQHILCHYENEPLKMGDNNAQQFHMKNEPYLLV